VVLKNYMEDAVAQNMGVLIQESGICKCDKCRLDVMALSLNALKPHYVVSEAGNMYAKLSEFDNQNKVDIISAITAAIEKIKTSPRH